MATVRRALALLSLVCWLLPVPLSSQTGEGPALEAVSVVGPDGEAGAAIERALLHGWRVRGGRVTYTGYPSQPQVVRGLAAMREQAPPDLAILYPQAAEIAFARGLVMAPPPGSVPATRLLLPIAREAGGVCVPIAFDALAIVVPAVAGGVATPGLAALDLAAASDRVALPVPAETLGAYLASLLAYAETGDWRRSETGLRRLAALRTAAPTSAAGTASRTFVTWNSAAQAEAARSPGLVAAVPQEGVMLRPILLCLSASAAHLQAALALIELALQPEAQGRLAAALHVAPAREGVALPGPVRARVPDLAAAVPARLVLPDPRFIARLRAAGPALADGGAPPRD